MRDVVKQFQATIFEMLMNNLLTERQFSILEALTDNIEEALEVIERLTIEDSENEDISDCIIAKEFNTALIILKE